MKFLQKATVVLTYSKALKITVLPYRTNLLGLQIISLHQKRLKNIPIIHYEVATKKTQATPYNQLSYVPAV